MRTRTIVFTLMMHATFTQAQHPVILTGSAQTLGSNTLQLGIGVEYFEKHQAPDSGFPVSETRLFTSSFHFGVAENVDFNLDWRGRLLGKLANGTSISDWGDLTVSTKIKILAEAHAPISCGVQTAVKLPNTKYLPYKLGSDQTDFFFHIVASKKFSTVETRFNIGLGIIGSPRAAGEQDDIYMYSVAGIAPIFSSTLLFTEIYGFTGHLEDDNKLLVRCGVTQTMSDFEISLYGSVRIVGNNVDYATAFEASENWGIGFFLKKSVTF